VVWHRLLRSLMEPPLGRKSARTAAIPEGVQNDKSVIAAGGGLGKSDLVENSAEAIVSEQPSTASPVGPPQSFPKGCVPVDARSPMESSPATFSLQNVTVSLRCPVRSRSPCTRGALVYGEPVVAVARCTGRGRQAAVRPQSPENFLPVGGCRSPRAPRGWPA
jgi:hypothetical protein